MNNKPNLKEQALIEEYCTYLCIGTRESYDKKTIKQYRDDIWEYWEITEFANLKDFNADQKTEDEQSCRVFSIYFQR